MTPNPLQRLLFGKDTAQAVATYTCVTCEAVSVQAGLQSDLHRREYRISGMCQDCQDQAFSTEEEG